MILINRSNLRDVKLFDRKFGQTRSFPGKVNEGNNLFLTLEY